MALSSDIIEVLNKIDITAYLDREGIDYRESHGSSGLQLNLRTCPKCGGDKWKVFLNADSGLGNCFSGSCGTGFNKFSFIRHSSGLAGRGLDEHLKAVGSEIGWRPPRKSVAVEEEKGELVFPDSFELPINGKNLTYLENRGITLELAQYFHLRYCHKAWWTYQQDGEARYVKFDKRVIIPVYDIDGTLVSFQGRDMTGTAERKYLFPNGYASTGEHLYNSHNVHNTDAIAVAEGVFDVIATKRAFDEEPDLRHVVPVGTFGMHLAHGQVGKFRELMARGVKTVTILWDGELVATEKAVKAGLQLVGMGLRVRVASLPEGCDPNDVAPSVLRHAYYGARELTKLSAVQIIMARRGHNVSKH